MLLRVRGHGGRVKRETIVRRRRESLGRTRLVGMPSWLRRHITLPATPIKRERERERESRGENCVHGGGCSPRFKMCMFILFRRDLQRDRGEGGKICFGVTNGVTPVTDAGKLSVTPVLGRRASVVHRSSEGWSVSATRRAIQTCPSPFLTVASSCLSAADPTCQQQPPPCAFPIRPDKRLTSLILTLLCSNPFRGLSFSTLVLRQSLPLLAIHAQLISLRICRADLN